MGNIFSGSEIVELGIQIEKNGQEFYNTLTDQAKKEEAKEIFKYLSGEEEKHIAVFQGMLEKLGETYEPPQAYIDEYYGYMKTLASGYVFTQKNKGKELARETKSDKEAVDLGISFEKESILFYVGLKEAVPKGDQGIVDALIKEEQGHLKKLSDLKKRL